MSSALDAAAVDAQMGPLEFAVYRSAFKAGRKYRRHMTAADPGSEPAAAAETSPEEPSRDDAEEGGAVKSVFARLRLAQDPEEPEWEDIPSACVSQVAPTPGRIASLLLLARAFDGMPGLIEAIRRREPVVVIVEVPDGALLSRIALRWQSALGLEELSFRPVDLLSDTDRRNEQDALSLIVKQPIPPLDQSAADARAYVSVQMALPILVFCPQAARHLSPALIDAATHRLSLPKIDGALIARTVSAVTGSRCRAAPPDDVVRETGIHELLLAIRFDRTPTECMHAVGKLAGAKRGKRASRDLRLDQIHGLDEGVAWGRALIRDLDAWRHGDLGWDALDAGAIFDGPSGTGKTTLAKVIAEAGNVGLVTASLAQWQSSGEGHLGHLLRAMKSDFDQARAKSPCILFIDEIDSFPRRDVITHSHRDYVIQVVNALLEQLDGLAGREGLIFIGATNKVERCDPAIVRAGRMNRVIRIRLPDAKDLEKMFRVRLRGDLAGADLSELCLHALGSTGADVERVVKDARRFARHEARPLSSADLLRALTGGEELAGRKRGRVAAHEGAHIVADVVLFGAQGVNAVIANMGDRAGAVIRMSGPEFEGTYEDYHRRLQVMVAGRTGEELLLGNVSHGAHADLADATALAAAMVGSFGLAGRRPLLHLAASRETNELLSHAEVRADAHVELEKATDACRSLLSQNLKALRKVVAILEERGRIDGATVADIIAGQCASWSGL